MRAVWILAVLVQSSIAHAGELHYDVLAPYLQRTDKIYAGAGDAKSVNAATHMVDPWPRGVLNRNIPANGERMVGAITRYRDTTKLPQAPPPLAPVEIGTSGFTGSGGSSGAATGAR
ncbi:MAG TPA: hypothetical protein VNR39_10745 [Pseudolabrys sp.]|nr:hypothetical protein [Pseudolabrys sp.]